MPDDTQPVAVYYDLDVHLAGQRYLLQAREQGPGYITIPGSED